MIVFWDQQLQHEQQQQQKITTTITTEQYEVYPISTLNHLPV